MLVLVPVVLLPPPLTLEAVLVCATPALVAEVLAGVTLPESLLEPVPTASLALGVLPAVPPALVAAELPLGLPDEPVLLGELAFAELPVSAVAGALPAAVVLELAPAGAAPSEAALVEPVPVEVAVVSPLDPVALEVLPESLPETELLEPLSGDVLREPVLPALPLAAASGAMLLEPELLVLPGSLPEAVLPPPAATSLLELGVLEPVPPEALPVPVFVSALAGLPVGLVVDAGFVAATVPLPAVPVVDPVLPEPEAAEPELSASAAPVQSELTPTIRMLHVMATSSRTRALSIVALLYHFFEHRHTLI